MIVKASRGLANLKRLLHAYGMQLINQVEQFWGAWSRNVFPSEKTSWQRSALEGLLIFQLTVAPVISLSFPLLYFTLALLGFHLTRTVNQRFLKCELALLFLGMLLPLNAFLAKGITGMGVAFVNWESGIGLAWLMGRSITPKLGGKVLRWLVFSSLIWLGIGFAQGWAGTPTPSGWLDATQRGSIAVRIYAVFGNPNIYGLYLLCLLPLSFGMVQSAGASILVRITAGVVVILAVIALYLTYSRWSWIMAGCFLAYLIWNFPVWRRWLVTGVLFLALGTVHGVSIRVGTLLSWSDSSAIYRVQIWKAVAGILQQHWFWGVGPGGFSQVYPWFEVGKTPCQHAHSFYLQFWLEYGLVAGLAWVLFGEKMVQAIRQGWMDLQLRSVGLAWLAFWGIGLVESWQVSVWASGYFWVLTGLFLALCKKGVYGE